MKTLNAKDIEKLENTSVATALVAAGTVGGDEDPICQAETIGCVVVSCLEESVCDRYSICEENSNNCEEATACLDATENNELLPGNAQLLDAIRQAMS